MESSTVMYSPTTKLIAKVSTVRLRTCSRVGQLTFLSSDQTSSIYRRKRFTSSFFFSRYMCMTVTEPSERWGDSRASHQPEDWQGR